MGVERVVALGSETVELTEGCEGTFRLLVLRAVGVNGAASGTAEEEGVIDRAGRSGVAGIAAIKFERVGLSDWKSCFPLKRRREERRDSPKDSLRRPRGRVPKPPTAEWFP